jgi:hypothetical protein
MNHLYCGTTIVAVREPTAVHLGVDSKVIAIGGPVSQHYAFAKIHEHRGIVFAHAGIFRDANGLIDVPETVIRCIDGHGDLRSAVAAVPAAIIPSLQAVVGDLMRQNPAYVRDQVDGKAILEVVCAGLAGGEPTLLMQHFRIRITGGSITVDVVSLACPGDCPGGASVIALGRHEQVDAFLDREPLHFRAHGAAATICEAIRLQARATPADVALPITLAILTPTGITWRRDLV